MLELKRLAKHLESHEEEFAKLLAEKTNADMLAEKKNLETELNRATARNEMITSLFAKTYEDNVSGKLSDEMYIELSHKYEVERLELKTKIFEYKERLAKISEMEQNLLSFCRLLGATVIRGRKLQSQHPKRRRCGVYPNSKIRIREKVSRHKKLLTTYIPEEIE